MFVSVLPDVNSRLCDYPVQTVNGTVDIESQPVEYGSAIANLRQLMCDLSILWLIWAIVQIVGINLVFYGIKNIRWRFFLPHLIMRFLGTGVLGCLVAILSFSAVTEQDNTAHIIGLIFIALLVVFWIYATITECWCAHFVKRSQETGFSISVARPIGPATISLSEREAPASVSGFYSVRAHCGTPTSTSTTITTFTPYLWSSTRSSKIRPIKPTQCFGYERFARDVLGQPTCLRMSLYAQDGDRNLPNICCLCIYSKTATSLRNSEADDRLQ
nr:Hypothetical protein CBG16191 [Haemonchus contortus]